MMYFPTTDKAKQAKQDTLRCYEAVAKLFFLENFFSTNIVRQCKFNCSAPKNPQIYTDAVHLHICLPAVACHLD